MVCTPDDVGSLLLCKNAAKKSVSLHKFYGPMHLVYYILYFVSYVGIFIMDNCLSTGLIADIFYVGMQRRFTRSGAASVVLLLFCPCFGQIQVAYQLLDNSNLIQATVGHSALFDFLGSS
jgi:hypothetical protein